MNYLTAGESHGPAQVALVYDVPAGVTLSPYRMQRDMARRQRGYGRGGRQHIETDQIEVLSGVRFGKTLGTPIALMVKNTDHANWLDTMSVWGAVPQDYEPFTKVRPGHADLAGAQKIATQDSRDILERASARETAARVAAGTIAKAVLFDLGVSIDSFVSAIGSVCYEPSDVTTIAYDEVRNSDVACPDEKTAQAMRDEIDRARAQGDSLGGVVTVVVRNLIPGVGGYASAHQRLDARLAGALMSIQAIKGVEIGAGFACASTSGSLVHDPIELGPDGHAVRRTNNAGGIEGGMTNGEVIVIKAAMKPIPTLMTPLDTVDLITGQKQQASRERSDVCAVPAASVVAEAEVAFVVANAYLEKFGGDTISDTLAAIEHYRQRIGW